MICEKCNEILDPDFEQILHEVIDGKEIIICRECYEDYWDAIDREREKIYNEKDINNNCSSVNFKLQ